MEGAGGSACGVSSFAGSAAVSELSPPWCWPSSWGASSALRLSDKALHDLTRGGASDGEHSAPALLLGKDAALLASAESDCHKVANRKVDGSPALGATLQHLVAVLLGIFPVGAFVDGTAPLPSIDRRRLPTESDPFRGWLDRLRGRLLAELAAVHIDLRPGCALPSFEVRVPGSKPATGCLSDGSP